MKRSAVKVLAWALLLIHASSVAGYAITLHACHDSEQVYVETLLRDHESCEETAALPVKEVCHTSDSTQKPCCKDESPEQERSCCSEEKFWVTTDDGIFNSGVPLKWTPVFINFDFLPVFHVESRQKTQTQLAYFSRPPTPPQTAIIIQNQVFRI